MLSVRTFSVLCLVTLCVVIAAALVSKGSDAIPGGGKPLFPDLISRLNQIQEVHVENSSQRFVLKRGDGGWTAPEKSGYPADGDKIHKLLLGTAGLSRVEPKTSDPARYPRLGLVDPGVENSPAQGYRLQSDTDSTVASLIVGNSAPAKGDPDLSEFYVRLPGEPRAWLVEGKLPRGDTLVDWLDRAVAEIDRTRVRESVVRHASGEVVSVARESPGNDDFRLEDAPPSKTVDGQWKLNDIGRLFSNLELEDVRALEEAPIQGEPDYVVTMRTFDGLLVRMEVFRRGDETLGALIAEFNPQQAETGAARELTASLLSADEVRAQADKLNARWARWAYVLPGFKVDALARTQSELLKDRSKVKDSDQG